MKLERGHQPEGRSDNQLQDPAPDKQQERGARNNVETGPTHIVLVKIDLGCMLRTVDVGLAGLTFRKDRVGVFLFDIQLVTADRPDEYGTREEGNTKYM